MCLGELAQVVDVSAGSTALVRSSERLSRVSLLTLDEPLAPGDWVVCHSGFALSRITDAAAREAARIRAETTWGDRPASHPTMTATTTEEAP